MPAGSPNEIYGRKEFSLELGNSVSTPCGNMRIAIVPIDFTDVQVWEACFQKKYRISDDNLPIVRFWTWGWSDQEIADELLISISAYSKKAQAIRNAMGAKNRASAVTMANRFGIGFSNS